MEYYSVIKRDKCESVEVAEPRAYYTEWNKSEREKQISYINAYIYMESREMVPINLFAG